MEVWHEAELQGEEAGSRTGGKLIRREKSRPSVNGNPLKLWRGLDLHSKGKLDSIYQDFDGQEAPSDDKVRLNRQADLLSLLQGDSNSLQCKAEVLKLGYNCKLLGISVLPYMSVTRNLIPALTKTKQKKQKTNACAATHTILIRTIGVGGWAPPKVFFSVPQVTPIHSQARKPRT
jgi:hypothetical protein